MTPLEQAGRKRLIAKTIALVVVLILVALTIYSQRIGVFVALGTALVGAMWCGVMITHAINLNKELNHKVDELSRKGAGQ